MSAGMYGFNSGSDASSHGSIPDDELEAILNAPPGSDFPSLSKNESILPKKKSLLNLSILNQSKNNTTAQPLQNNNENESEEKSVKILPSRLFSKPSLLPTDPAQVTSETNPLFAGFTLPSNSDFNAEPIVEDDFPDIPLPSVRNRSSNSPKKRSPKKESPKNFLQKESKVPPTSPVQSEDDIWKQLEADVIPDSSSRQASRSQSKIPLNDNSQTENNAQPKNHLIPPRLLVQTRSQDSLDRTEIKPKPDSDTSDKIFPEISETSAQFSAPEQNKLEDPITRVNKLLASDFDKTSSDFHRLFKNELSILMQPPVVSPYCIDLDKFSKDLVADVSAIIEKPLTGTNIALSTVQTKLDEIFDTNVQQIMTALKEANNLKTTLQEKAAIEMGSLAHKIKTLKKYYKDSSKKMLRELHREKQDILSVRNAESEIKQNFEKQLHEMALSKMELESQINIKIALIDDMERKFHKLETHQLEFERYVYMCDMPNKNSFYSTIVDELNSIQEEINGPQYEQLLNEATLFDFKLKSNIQKLKNEHAQLQLFVGSCSAAEKEQYYKITDTKVEKEKSRNRKRPDQDADYKQKRNVDLRRRDQNKFENC